jgi:hypothetical protein
MLLIFNTRCYSSVFKTRRYFSIFNILTKKFYLKSKKPFKFRFKFKFLKFKIFRFFRLKNLNRNYLSLTKVFKYNIFKYFFFKKKKKFCLYDSKIISISHRVPINYYTYLNEIYHTFFSKILNKRRIINYIGNRGNFFYNLNKNFLYKLRETRILH